MEREVQNLTRVLKEGLAKKISKKMNYCDVDNGTFGIPSRNSLLWSELVACSPRFDIDLFKRVAHYGICDLIRKRYDFLVGSGKELNEANLELNEFALAYAFRNGNFSSEELAKIRFMHEDFVSEFIEKYDSPLILKRVALSFSSFEDQDFYGVNW